MLRISGFHPSYRSLAAYHRGKLYDRLTAIATANGLTTPKPEHVYSSLSALEKLRSGDVLILCSIVDLAPLDEIGPIVRKLVGHGVRIVTGEFSDVVPFMRLIENLSHAAGELVRENATLQAKDRSVEKLVAQKAGAIAAMMTEKLERVAREAAINLASDLDIGPSFIDEVNKRTIEAAAKSRKRANSSGS